MRIQSVCAATWAWLALESLALAQGAVSANVFARCDALFSEQPENYASSRCYYEVAREEGSWGKAAARVEELVAGWPENHWLKLVLGHIERSRNPERVEDWYLRAAEGFQAQGHAEGEVTARSNLLLILEREGRTEEAEREIDARCRWRSLRGGLLVARAMTARASSHHVDRWGPGVRLSQSPKGRAGGVPDGPYPLRRDILMELGNVSFEMGRLDEALGHYRRLEILNQEARNPYSEAMVKYNIANTFFETTKVLPRPGGERKLLGWQKRHFVSPPSAEPQPRRSFLRLLGELLSNQDRETALSHARRCVELSRERHQERELSHCLWTEARLLTSANPVRAHELIDEALAVAAESGQSWPIVYVSRQRMHTSWSTAHSRRGDYRLPGRSRRHRGGSRSPGHRVGRGNVLRVDE